MRIKGFFKGKEPRIKISLAGLKKKQIEVLLDTGFNGDLMLPEERIKELALEKVGTDSYTTASGKNVITTAHLGFLEWFGKARRVTVLATKGNHALIGMQLLYFCHLDIIPFKGKLIISSHTL